MSAILENNSDFKRQALTSAFAEAQKGIFISEEAMMSWFDSLDTEYELPEPKPDVFLK